MMHCESDHPDATLLVGVNLWIWIKAGRKVSYDIMSWDGIELSGRKYCTRCGCILNYNYWLTGGPS